MSISFFAAFIIIATPGDAITINVPDLPGIGYAAQNANADIDDTVNVAGLIKPPGEQDWDFTSLVVQLSGREFLDVVDPSEDPCHPVIPGLSVLIHAADAVPGGYELWNYVEFTDSGMTTWAQCQPGTLFPLWTFDAPGIQWPNSMTVGTQWVSQTTMRSGDLAIDVTETSIVDGWGTVTLPGLGTLPCLRINTVRELQGSGFHEFDRSYAWITQDHFYVTSIVSPPDSNAAPAPEFSIAAGANVTIEANVLPSVPSDLDGDGSVGFSDLLLLLGAWGPCGTSCPYDIDGSGDVGFSDLVHILSDWS